MSILAVSLSKEHLCIHALLPHEHIIKNNIYGAGGTPTHGGGISATFPTGFHTSLAQVVAIAIQT